MSPVAPFAGRPLFEILRQLCARGATGVLEFEIDGGLRRLYLREGELHLPGAHPLARRLSELLAAPGAPDAPDREATAALLELVERIADVLAEWQPARWQFREGLAHLPANLVGPLPTVRLLMAGAVVGLDEPALEARFAGLSGPWVADVSRAMTAPPGFLPEELFLLERLRLPTAIRDLIAESPIPAAALRRALLRLAAVGAVHPRVPGGRSAAASPAEEQREFVARIAERIARDLAERPLELDAERYRTLIADLLGRHGGLDHYELLGVSPGAGSDQIQAAFERLARLSHPVNAPRFGNAGSEGALAVLFESATRAYETLMDPEQRRAYNEREMIDVPAAAASGEQREAERRTIARDQFQRAQAYVKAGDLHNAISLLEQAVQTDPRAEYWIGLGRLQAHNPGWKDRALESFRRALLLEPQNAEGHYASAQFFEQQGELERARSLYQTAVRIDPGHLEAVARLAALDARRAEKTTKGRGLVARFVRRR